MFTVSENQGVTSLRMGRKLLGRQLRVTHSFWVDGLVVEGGCPYFKKQIYEFYREKRPQGAVFSHGHEDHAGNVDLFNRLGIQPYVHQDAAGYLATAPSIPYYRRFVWGAPAAGECQAAGEVIETDRYSFRVIASPGHAEDHICLFEEKQGWLFTGDLYVGERIYYLYENENLDAMKKTLRALSGLSFSTLFCSHRGPLQRGPEALLRKLHHIESLEQKAGELQRKGYPQREITKRLLGREDYMHFISRGEFSKTALVRALLSGMDIETDEHGP